MFGWLRKRASKRAVRRAIRTLRARYDAAVTTDDNRRHWANADGLSADAAASPGVRRTLRMRARYEVANNSYAKGIVQTLANYVIGTGPRLQLLTDDAEVNRVIEREFNRWAKAVGLPQKLRTMRMGRATDGEAFALLINNPNLRREVGPAGEIREFPVKLDLRLMEADQFATPDWSNPLAENAVDGIVFDAFGNPVEYHVLKHHPGDMRGTGLDYSPVPAKAVLHYFRADRPGQHRGLPEILPALPLFAQLRRYTLAVIAAAETAADYAAVIYSDLPPDVDPDKLEAMDTIELEKRMATVMPGGWKLAQLRAEQPTTTHGEFKNTILNEIARCLDMPFNIAAGNSSGYNYASGRLDHQTFFKSIAIDQGFTETTQLDRIFTAWLDEAVLVEGYLPQAARLADAEFPHQWFWDGYEHVDPAKEANAQNTKLSNGMTSYAREYARAGQDWEEEQRKQAAALGVSVEEYRRLLREKLFGQARPAVPAGNMAEEDDDDE